MRLQFILRKIIMPVVFSIPLFFCGSSAVFVRDFNVKYCGNDIFALTLLACAELIVILAAWEFLFLKLSVRVSILFDKIARRSIRRHNARGAMIAIRLDFGLGRAERLLGQGWSYRGLRFNRDLWSGLRCWSVKNGFARVVRMLLSVPLLLSIMVSCITVWSNNSGFAGRIDGLWHFVEVDLWVSRKFENMLSWGPGILAIMPIVSILLYLYFHTQNKEVKKMVDLSLRPHREKVVLLYKELLLWFDRNILDLCKNFDYVVSNYSEFVRETLACVTADSGTGCEWGCSVADAVDGYSFVEFDDLCELSNIVCKLRGEELEWFTRVFSWRNEATWYLYLFEFDDFTSVESLESALFTKSGMQNWIANPIGSMRKLNAKQAERFRIKIEERLVSKIYFGLRLLYVIDRSRTALRRSLYSTPSVRLMQKVVSREK